MKTILCVLAWSAATATATPARILHQTNGSFIVRMDADESRVAWQEVGDEGAKKFLYTLSFANGAKGKIEAGKRPFGPALSGGALVFGAGDFVKKVDVVLHDAARGAAVKLDKQVPWIVEPAVQPFALPGGAPGVRVAWDRSRDTDGLGLAVMLYEGGVDGKGRTRVAVEGPIELREVIPPENHAQVHNEYPELSGDTLVFQNDEYGMPGIYRMELVSRAITRLAPSSRYQERPSVDGDVTAWEESEKGFSVSDVSDVFAHDSATGELLKLNGAPGFHFQVKVYRRTVLYGAKREPMPSTPSLRIYDLDARAEIAAEKCFPGSIFAHAANSRGVLAAQKFSGASSRLLFATWEQLREGCK